MLIIGSPAANLMARAVNRGACFSFDVTREALAFAEEFPKILKDNFYYPEELEKFTEGKCENQFQKEWSSNRGRIIFGFARSGILDPIDFKGMRGTATNAGLDYGVVTLCRHPWSENRAAIIAAGLHGPGTAAAVQLLSTEDAFVDHPLGGVFKVSVPSEAPWEQRYHHLKPKLETHKYDVKKYEASVSDPKLDQMKFWNSQDVRDLLNVIRRNK